MAKKKEAKVNKDNKKETKNQKNFFKGFKAELKKVNWPTPKQLFNNTVAVITIVLITAAIVFVLDLTFDLLNNQGVNKLKEVIGNTTSTETNNISENSVEDSNIVEENVTDSNTVTTEQTENNAE